MGMEGMNQRRNDSRQTVIIVQMAGRHPHMIRVGPGGCLSDDVRLPAKSAGLVQASWWSGDRIVCPWVVSPSQRRPCDHVQAQSSIRIGAVSHKGWILLLCLRLGVGRLRWLVLVSACLNAFVPTMCLQFKIVQIIGTDFRINLTDQIGADFNLLRCNLDIVG